MSLIPYLASFLHSHTVPSLSRNVYHLLICPGMGSLPSFAFFFCFPFLCFVCFRVCLFSYLRKSILSPTTITKCMALSNLLNFFAYKIEKIISVHRAIVVRIRGQSINEIFHPYVQPMDGIQRSTLPACFFSSTFNYCSSNVHLSSLRNPK